MDVLFDCRGSKGRRSNTVYIVYSSRRRVPSNVALRMSCLRPVGSASRFKSETSKKEREKKKERKFSIYISHLFRFLFARRSHRREILLRRDLSRENANCRAANCAKIEGIMPAAVNSSASTRIFYHFPTRASIIYC